MNPSEPPNPPQRAAIALGSNLPSHFGNREDNLREAIARLAHFGRIDAVSSFLDTAPVGFVEQPHFLNAAVLLETHLQPLPLLRELLQMEHAMGRRREAVPAKGPRIIDLDLLWFDQLVLETPELTLPHPALPDRPFVLEPLVQIAPEWIHPVLHASAAQLLARLA